MTGVLTANRRDRLICRRLCSVHPLVITGRSGFVYFLLWKEGKLILRDTNTGSA